MRINYFKIVIKVYPASCELDYKQTEILRGKVSKVKEVMAKKPAIVREMEIDLEGMGGILPDPLREGLTEMIETTLFTKQKDFFIKTFYPHIEEGR